MNELNIKKERLKSYELPNDWKVIIELVIIELFNANITGNFINYRIEIAGCGLIKILDPELSINNESNDILWNWLEFLRKEENP